MGDLTAAKYGWSIQCFICLQHYKDGRRREKEGKEGEKKTSETEKG